MALKIEGRRRPYVPRGTDEVRCDTHGTVTTWGVLTAIQRLALEAGLDTAPDLECLLAPNIHSACEH